MSNTTKTPTKPQENNPAVIMMNERIRLRDVMNAPEAQGRTATATKLLVSTNLSALAIIDLLADMPRETSNSFIAAMEREGAIGIGSPIGSIPADDPKAARMAELAQVAQQHNVIAGYVAPNKKA